MMKPSFPLGVSPSALMVIAGVTMEIPFSRVTIQIFSHIARKVNLHQVLLLEAFHTKGIMLKAVMAVSYFWELHHQGIILDFNDLYIKNLLNVPFLNYVTHNNRKTCLRVFVQGIIN